MNFRKTLKKQTAMFLAFVMMVLCFLPFMSKTTAEAATYTDAILVQSSFKNSSWTVGEKINIPFDLYSYGNYGHKYYVEIYDSNINMIASTSGSFSSSVGLNTTTITWDTAGKTSGKYYVRFYATYPQEIDDTLVPFYLNEAKKSDEIIIDTKFVGSNWKVGDIVNIPFSLYSFGNSNHKYYVEIYDSNKKMIYNTSGYFSNSIATTTKTIAWDTTGRTSGTYYVKCYATYSQDLDNTFWKFQLTPNGKLEKIDGNWCYTESGKVNKSYVGMAQNEYGWWYVENGTINFNYTGMAQNEYGWWYIKNGKLDKTYTGIAKNAYGEWYMKNGKLDKTRTGLVDIKGSWYYIKNGKLDKTYTGLAQNQYGWWYMKNGKLDKTYAGMAKNQYGWWYVKNGKLDKTYTGLAKNEYGWWYMKNGKLDKTYTGMAKNQYGWWYVKNGKLDKTYTGMAKNQYGWWYLEKGTINFKYTGLAKNQYGEWYMQKGKLDTKFSGKVTLSGKTYTVKNGKINHTWKNSTCTTAKTCTQCGTTEGTALGHSYSAATCTKAKTCTRCGVTQGSALGHNYKYTVCTKCGSKDPKYTNKNTYGSTVNLTYESDTSKTYKLTIGQGYKFDYVDNQFSDIDGQKFIGFPVTITNTGQSSYNALGVLLFDCNLYAANGLESKASYSAYFNDWDDLMYTSLRPGSSISGYIYIEYTGAGTYYIDFEVANGKVVEIELPVTQ